MDFFERIFRATLAIVLALVLVAATAVAQTTLWLVISYTFRGRVEPASDIILGLALFAAITACGLVIALVYHFVVPVFGLRRYLSGYMLSGAIGVIGIMELARRQQALDMSSDVSWWGILMCGLLGSIYGLLLGLLVRRV